MNDSLKNGARVRFKPYEEIGKKSLFAKNSYKQNFEEKVGTVVSVSDGLVAVRIDGCERRCSGVFPEEIFELYADKNDLPEVRFSLDGERLTVEYGIGGETFISTVYLQRYITDPIERMMQAVNYATYKIIKNNFAETLKSGGDKE